MNSIKRGHAVIRFGAINPNDPDPDWVLASAHAAQAVSRGEADEGIVCCWTGTGASIAANKIKGIRCALVHDAQTAKGARIWNHANVLALSLRATPIPIMREIFRGVVHNTDGWGRSGERMEFGAVEEVEGVGGVRCCVMRDAYCVDA